MAYGITTDGFVDKPLEVIKTELETDLKAALGSNLNTTATSVTGQFIGIFGSKIREVWEVAQAVYSAFDPDAASGNSLTDLASLTGTLRNPATYSTVTATINLNNTVTVNAGSIASVSGNPTARFQTLTTVTNNSGIAADFQVSMSALSTGPVVANAGTLTVIETPVAGWNSITNALDATVGENIESDADLRIRRTQELRAQGTSTFDSIVADLLTVPGVKSVYLFENITDVTDVNGLPPHSIEALVLGGADQAIGDKIWAIKPVGIRSYGSVPVTVIDILGGPHNLYFSRPTVITIFIDIYLTKDSTLYPVDGAAQIKANIVEYANEHYGVGDDVIISSLYAPIFEVSGVIDVTSILVYSNQNLGSESLNETDFSTHAFWDVTGGFTDNTGAAVYTHSAGTGTLTQTSANMAIVGIANRWYAFTYTITGSTGAKTANITTGFADSATNLDVTNGTKTVYVHTNAAPGNFVISVTSTSGGFTMDNVSLKVLNTASSNYVIGTREIASIDSSRITVVAT